MQTRRMCCRRSARDRSRRCDAATAGSSSPPVAPKVLRVATVQGILCSLSTVLSQAVEDELIDANPVLRMGKHLRQGGEPTREIQPLTRDEVALLLTVALEHFPRWHLVRTRDGRPAVDGVLSDELTSFRLYEACRLMDLVCERGRPARAILASR